MGYLLDNLFNNNASFGKSCTPNDQAFFMRGHRRHSPNEIGALLCEHVERNLCQEEVFPNARRGCYARFRFHSLYELGCPFARGFLFER